MLYTPAAGYHGADSFTFRASDGTASSTPATASITVTRAPTCTSVTRRTAVGAPGPGPGDLHGPGRRRAHALDRGPRPPTARSGRSPSGAVTYTPDAGYHGTDSFTFAATDETADSAPATATPHGHARPDAAPDAARTTKVGVAVTVPLICTDPDGDALTLEKAGDPAKGTLSAFVGRLGDLHAGRRQVRPRLVHLPRHRRHGDLRARHGLDHHHARPELLAVGGRTAVGEPVTVALACTDLDDDPLDVTIVDGPDKGSLGAVAGDEVTYTPDPGESGEDTFTFRASDGTAQSTVATATITITRPPACEDVSVRTSAGTAVQVPLACETPTATR